MITNSSSASSSSETSDSGEFLTYSGGSSIAVSDNSFSVQLNGGTQITYNADDENYTILEFDGSQTARDGVDSYLTENNYLTLAEYDNMLKQKYKRLI